MTFIYLALPLFSLHEDWENGANVQRAAGIDIPKGLHIRYWSDSSVPKSGALGVFRCIMNILKMIYMYDAASIIETNTMKRIKKENGKSYK